ncbi:uncharacterized protein LOC103848390 [Brassica rapa]|uniref:uncharacterized protein LOC103848390 n=1 Tax=Brassica campestris TaxID=3711 RepID=UPI00142DAC71|nr:uncharacterized protein LOC103848390 [Brassica rapa]
MEEEDRSSPPLRIPDRIFAVDHEPVGVRVTPYHKPYAIRQILNALDPEEVDTIRGSSFGKLIEIGEKLSFSGRFGRFIISRQLLVSSKHEAWFIFAGKPVRFSLREFAYVTGLNCRKLPKHTKKRAKKIISEKPYWGELFGTLKEVPVTSVVRMLKKRTVKDSCIRVKYALLALLAAVILPTTHTPRISQDHAELIKDIDDFFAYPWGRVSFDMVMSSIKERKEVSLSQKTIALKGFVLSLQLVMVEAIPALTEVVNDGSSSGSESDGCEEDDLVDEDKNGKRSLSPGHARAIDAAGEVAVHSIIVEDKEHFKASPDLGWSDDEEDPIVDNLMTLLEQQFPFNKSSFTGGVTKLEVNRMREGAKTEAINRKTVKPKQTKQTTTSEVIDVESVASMVRDKVREDLSRIERKLSTLSESFITFQTNVLESIQQLVRKLEVSSGQIPVSSSAQTENVSNVSRDGQHRDIRRTSPHCVGIHTESAQNDIINDAIRFANQTTSLPVDGLNGGQGIQPVIHTGNQTQRDSHEEMITDHPPVAILFSNQANIFSVDVASNTSASLVVDNPPPPYSLGREGKVADHRQSSADLGSTAPNLDPELLFTKPTFSLGLTQEERPHLKETVTEGVSMCENDVYHSQSSPDTNLDHELPFPKPTFSLGLTQEERPHQKEAATEGETTCANAAGKEICEQDDQLGACRKSKRLKALPKSLVGQYECDMRLLNRARVAFVDPDKTGGNIDYAAKFSSLLDKLKTPFTIRIGQSTLESNDLNELVQRSSPLPPKVVDVLIGHISSQFTLNSPPNQSNHPVFMDTQFVSQLSKLFTKFSKMSKKESFWFPSHILERVRSYPDADRYYLPFNLDRKHWVGVCVDCSSWSIVLMDCNIALRTDSMMVKEVTPIAQMFPYLLKQGGKQLLHKDARAFPIERPRSIPQNTSHADSAVSALLLVQAHAVAGVDLCKCITPDKIGSEVERLAIMFYEATVGML